MEIERGREGEEKNQQVGVKARQSTNRRLMFERVRDQMRCVEHEAVRTAVCASNSAAVVTACYTRRYVKTPYHKNATRCVYCDLRMLLCQYKGKKRYKVFQ